MFKRQKQRARIRENGGFLDGLLQGIDSGEAEGLPEAQVLEGLGNASALLGDSLLQAGEEWPPFLATGLNGLMKASSVKEAITAFFSVFTTDEADAIEGLGLRYSAEKTRTIGRWRITLYVFLASRIGKDRAMEIVPKVQPWLASWSVDDLELAFARKEATQTLLTEWAGANPGLCPTDVASHI